MVNIEPVTPTYYKHLPRPVIPNIGASTLKILVYEYLLVDGARPSEGLRGASLRRVLRTRCARANSLQANWSNPRTLSGQRFSRPPHSTALPALLQYSLGFAVIPPGSSGATNRVVRRVAGAGSIDALQSARNAGVL